MSSQQQEEGDIPSDYAPGLYLSPSFLPPLPSTLLDPTGLLLPSASDEASTSSHPIIQFDPKTSPTAYDDEDDDDDADEGVGQGRPKKRKSVANLRSAAAKDARSASAGGGTDVDDAEEKGRRKIMIEYIEEKGKRHITFSKRKAGIMKKAYELSTLTGTQVLLLVVSESGWVYTFTTDKFKPLVKEDENGQLSQGQKLIAACLETKEAAPQPSYPPTSTAGAFEANSAIHGGQIALKTNSRPPTTRPVATNRRVSSKGRNHIPTAINTGHPSMPPPLPTPMSGYLDPNMPGMGAGGLNSPISPRGRSRSSGPGSQPPSPANTRGGGMQMMQQQAQAQAQAQALQAGEYAEMLHRAGVMHMQHGGYEGQGQGQGQGQQYDGGSYPSPPTSQQHHPSIHRSMQLDPNQHPYQQLQRHDQPHQQQAMYGVPGPEYQGGVPPDYQDQRWLQQQPQEQGSAVNPQEGEW